MSRLPIPDPLTNREISKVLADFAEKKRVEAEAALPGGSVERPNGENVGCTTAQARANWLPAPAVFHLDHACAMIHDAFGECPYLVGSALLRRDYRDVDVRLMLPDEHFDALFPGAFTAPRYNPLWSLMCSTIADWLAKASGLPIDFQIQRRSEANAQYPGQRHALGMFHAVKLPTPYTTGHP